MLKYGKTPYLYLSSEEGISGYFFVRKFFEILFSLIN